MSLRFWVRDQDQTLLELTGRILFGFEFEESAEEGKTSVNRVIIDDPLGDLVLYGHRIFAVEETDAEDPDERFIAIGYMGTMNIIRGPHRTGAARQWSVEVADINTIFNRRVMLGGGNDRPAETDVARVTWVESTAEGSLIDDTRFLLSTPTTAMDANDYLLQEALSVYSDASNASGKNYYVTYFGDVGVDALNPWGSFSLWYGLPESSEYAATVSLSNDLGDIDNETVYPLFIEDELSIDPMRIASRVIVPYKDSYVTASNPITRAMYALLDKVMVAENVKTKAKAQQRANRYVYDLATTEHRATVKTLVPRAHVNRIRPGMNLGVKATHWPGYETTPLLMRVLSRRVVEVSEDDLETYELHLTLSRSEPGPPATPAGGILHQSKGPYNGRVYWNFTGDTPDPGYPVRATGSLIEPLVDGSPPNDDWPHYGWKILGTGTIDIEFFSTVIGVIVGSIASQHSITFSIAVNGVIVASEVLVTPNIGGPPNMLLYSGEQLVTATGIAVVPDDTVTGHISVSPPMTNFLTPVGAGQQGERLEITGGTLV